MSDPAPETTAEKPSPAEPVVLPCNFRSAGRLSNDSIRHLRTMHDSFARSLAHSLDLFLGSSLGVKMMGIEQVGAREFAASLAGGCYLVPFTLMPLQSRIIAKVDGELLSPLLDLLLGGSGDTLEQHRELTDIDEELIRSVTELIGIQLERTWKSCAVSVVPGGSVKPATVGQVLATEERVICLHFEITLGATRASMRIVLPMAFCNVLVRASVPEAGRRVGQELAATRRLRDRLLDCTMTVSAELTGLHITVGELVNLQPGSTLDLRAPVTLPVRLAVSGYPLFEVTPVRKRTRKAAQLGPNCQPRQIGRG